MLQDLKIKNGIMTPKYDIYNNIYSVTIDEDIEELEMTYDVIKGSTINITGNHDFKVGENVVYIDIFNKDEKETVTLYVKKEKAEVVSDFNYTPLEKIEIVKPLPEYVAPLISIVCFLIILTTFVLLFAKKKKRILKSNK